MFSHVINELCSECSKVSGVQWLSVAAATVTDKFYRRVQPERVEEARAARALQRLRRMFEAGPRDKYPAPLTASHEYIIMPLF